MEIKVARNLMNVLVVITIILFICTLGFLTYAILTDGPSAKLTDGSSLFIDESVRFDYSQNIHIEGLFNNFDQEMQRQLMIDTTLSGLLMIGMSFPIVLFFRNKLDRIVKRNEIFSKGDEKALRIAVYVSSTAWVISTLIKPLLTDIYIMDLSSGKVDVFLSDYVFYLEINFLPVVIISVIYIFFSTIFAEGYRLDQESKEII